MDNKGISFFTLLSEVQNSVLESDIRLLSFKYRTRFPHVSKNSNSSSNWLVDALITTDLTADDRKLIEFTATAGYWYHTAVIFGIVAGISGMFYQSTVLLGIAGVLCAGLTAFLVICVNRKMELRLSDSSHHTSVVDRTVSVHLLIPFVGIAGTLLGFFYLTGRFIYFGAMQLVLMISYALLLQWCVHAGQKKWSRHQISLFAMTPLSIVILSVVILTEASTVANTNLHFLLVILAPFTTIVSTVGWIWVGHELYQKIHERRFEPIRSVRVRAMLFVIKTGVILSSVFVIGLLINGGLSYLGVLSESYRIVEPIFGGIGLIIYPLPWSNTISMFAYFLLIVSPLVVSLSMWIYYIGTQFVAQQQILAQATRLEPPWEHSSSVEMYLTELDGGLAQTIPLWLHGRSIIVVDTAFAKLLDPEELQAVYHHEIYHIRHHHPWVVDILLGFAPPIWVNVMAPYFYPPTIESDAHAYAQRMTNRGICESVQQKASRIQEQQLESKKQVPIDTDSLGNSVGIRQRYLEAVTLVYGNLIEVRSGVRF